MIPIFKNLFKYVKKILSIPFIRKTEGIKYNNINNTDTIKKVEHHIVIGIDFGSSISKIIIRDDQSKRLPFIIYPNTPEYGLPRFAFPTRISIKNDRIYFGNYLRDYSFSFPYLKVCFICVDDEKCNDCHFGKGIVAPGKIFKCLGKIEIEELVTIFLSFLISTAKSQINEYLIKEKIKPKFFYVMGAPLNRIDSEEKEKFEKCLFWASIITSQTEIINNISFTDIHNLYLKIKTQNPVLPKYEYRDFFVWPESYAAIMTYLNSPIAKKGLYSIVDIGASTTDISVFWYTSEKKESHFYYSNTYHIGCNNIDEEILIQLYLSHDIEEILFKIQEARHFLFKNKKESKIQIYEGIHLERNDLEKSSRKVGVKIRKDFLKTLGLAKQKDQRNWPNLNLFIIGGGSKINEIVTCLKIPFNIDENGESMDNSLQDTKMTLININPFDEELNDNIEEQYLLWVAAGLSIHPRHWIPYFKASEVKPFKPLIKKFDVEERLRQYDG